MMSRKIELNNEEPSGGLAHVEVEGETGRWHSFGKVQLLDEHIESVPYGHRGQLPKSVKNLLAPVRSQRKLYYLFRHASGGASNTNLMIFLHGAGDNHQPFDQLGQTMELPQTATLSVSAKDYESLPFGLGHTWFQEMDYKSGETLPDDSPQRRDSLDAVATKFCHILEKLVVEEEWTLSEGIFLFGFGAGATLAMKVCLKWSKNGYAPLGGAICVAGGVVATDMSTTQQNMTPLLLMVGEKDNFFDPEKAREAARSYGANVTAIHVAPDKGRQMISSPAEMQQIMKFLSGRLLKLSNVPM